MTSQLPTTISKWQKAVAENGLTGISIHNETLVSASKFELRHFLPLRVIWKSVRPNRFKARQFGLEKWMKVAAKMLDKHPPWMEYRNTFYGKRPEGEFSLARVCQRDAAAVKSDSINEKVTLSHLETHPRAAHQHSSILAQPADQSVIGSPGIMSEDQLSEDIFISSMHSTSSTIPSRGPTEIWTDMYPQSEDEQIVNTALVIFLKALTLPFALNVDWTMHRKAFKAKFGAAEYEARTDGYLRCTATGEPRAIVEVKATLRSKKESEIRMQESAQMVSWLVSHPESETNIPFRRVHLTQDRHEVFVIFPVFDQEYLDYLRNDGTIDPKSSDPKTFLKMVQVGPFDTNSRASMALLGRICLAISLRADNDLKEEQAGRRQRTIAPSS